MKKNWNRLLRAAFEAPAPREKTAFLQQLYYPKLSYTGFLFHQLLYLRKRMWILFGALLGICVILSPYFLRGEDAGIWSNMRLVSAMLPLLVLVLATEISRASSCHMAELEMSCRFSFQQVIIARMFWLGGSNGVILIVTLLLARRYAAFGFLRLALYVLTPYVLTCALCLLFLNHMRGKEGTYVCVALSSMMSVCSGFAESAIQTLYTASCLPGWMLLACIGTGCTILQLHRYVKNLEEKPCSLFLIG